ncbi:MAG: DUF4362 domain-containing protein [Bacillus sp. (in: firmicutes)]
MNKLFRIAFLILPISLTLSACQQKNEAGNPQKPYPSEEAIQNKDVVNLHGKIKNGKRLEQFMQNAGEGKEDTIRITSYTLEGDPIFENLQSNKRTITYIYDNSQDEYAGSDKGIEKTSCSKIATENTTNGTEYTLNECISSEIGNMFHFVISK